MKIKNPDKLISCCDLFLFSMTHYLKTMIHSFLLRLSATARNCRVLCVRIQDWSRWAADLCLGCCSSDTNPSSSSQLLSEFEHPLRLPNAVLLEMRKNMPERCVRSECEKRKVYEFIKCSTLLICMSYWKHMKRPVSTFLYLSLFMCSCSNLFDV